MSVRFRHPEILGIARAEGRVSVDDLAGRFGVTHQTIRRDLADLAEAGQIERVHGGAVLPSGVSNIAYEERRRLNESAKHRIGAACAALVPDNACIFLGIGTTTEAVATALAQHRNLLVVTNNMNIAALMAPHPSARTIVTGGAMRAADGGLTGAHTLETLRRYAFDLAVIGCSAINAAGEMLDYDLDEVQVSLQALDGARQSLLVADQSKFARSAPLRIASVACLDGVISDAALPLPIARLCQASHTAIHCV